MPGMGAFKITAGVTFLRLPFFDNGAENRNLFLDFCAAAIRAISFIAVRCFFEDFKFFSAFFTDIFKNRHNFTFSPALLRYLSESGRVDLNHRPLGPEPSALIQAELRPGIKIKN